MPPQGEGGPSPRDCSQACSFLTACSSLFRTVPRHDFGLIVLTNGSVLALAGDGGDSPAGQNASNTTEIRGHGGAWGPAAPLSTVQYVSSKIRLREFRIQNSGNFDDFFQLSARAYWMPIGACNPMFCNPIHGDCAGPGWPRGDRADAEHHGHGRRKQVRGWVDAWV